MKAIDWFRGFGVLRLALVGTGVLIVLAGPFSGGAVDFKGFALVTTLIAPVAYAVFIFMLPLDMTMNAIFMSDTTPERRAALKRALITEAFLMGILLLAWLPFTLRLLRVR